MNLNMSLPPYLEKVAARYDAMSMRERILLSCAALTALVMVWMLALLDPLSAKQRALSAEKTTLDEQIGIASRGIQDANENNPTVLALAKEKQLQSSLDEINAQLADKSAGLIPPERMVQVIYDVLSRQKGVALVSLHNKPVMSLVQSAPLATETPTTALPEATTDGDGNEAPVAEEPVPDLATPEATGPFVHPIEIVIEGSYLDVLAYLKALESLEYRFYWKVLDLETKRYPVNRVRIELSTLSLDKNWIGV